MAIINYILKPFAGAQSNPGKPTHQSNPLRVDEPPTLPGGRNASAPAIPLTPEQQAKLRKAAEARNGILYDTGFNLHSHKQFCSRYVREVLNEATDINIGEVEKFSVLLMNNPNANQTFWKTWFFGGIPWNRETVTPASELQDKKMHVVFDGRAV